MPKPIRIIKQALQFPDGGDYMIVSCNEIHLESPRVFMGSSLDNLDEIKITNVESVRDGGTTYYKTEKGTLFCPKAAAITWTPKGSDNPVELEKLNTEEISKKIGESHPLFEVVEASKRGDQSWQNSLNNLGKGRS